MTEGAWQGVAAGEEQEWYKGAVGAASRTLTVSVSSSPKMRNSITWLQKQLEKSGFLLDYINILTFLQAIRKCEAINL